MGHPSSPLLVIGYRLAAAFNDNTYAVHAQLLSLPSLAPASPARPSAPRFRSVPGLCATSRVHASLVPNDAFAEKGEEAEFLLLVRSRTPPNCQHNRLILSSGIPPVLAVQARVDRCPRVQVDRYHRRSVPRVIIMHGNLSSCAESVFIAARRPRGVARERERENGEERVASNPERQLNPCTRPRPFLHNTYVQPRRRLRTSPTPVAKGAKRVCVTAAFADDPLFSPPYLEKSLFRMLRIFSVA